jgi:hypothetical protein
MLNDRAFLKIAASLIITIMFGSALFYSMLFAQGDEAISDNTGLSRMASNYFVIYYSPSANLVDIEKELTKRPLYFDQAARYGEVTAQEEICQRLDKLYNRVQDVLDMHPKTPRIKIRIFRDRGELNSEYAKIFGKPEDLKSFYVYKYNTIYTSESDIEDSVIIHETAHAIIDHYFSVIPGETIREILAAYVDAHLEG